MVLPKTRSKGGVLELEEAIEPKNMTTKTMTKPSAAATKALQNALEENGILKQDLENMKIKYSEKKRINRELNKTVKNQEQKIVEQENYIMKLRKDRKKAEQVHKHNVGNLVTASAQNQALMSVLTTQQQSVHQLVHPQLQQNLSWQSNAMLHQSVSNGLVGYPYPPLYPSTSFNNFQPRQQYLYQVNPSSYESCNENYKESNYQP